MTDRRNQDSSKVLYSISQVNAITGVATPTIRKWESTFRDYLQVARTEGGQRRFNQDAVEKIETLKQLIYEEGLSLEGARKRLENIDTPDANPEMVDPQVEKLAEMVTNMLLKRLLKDKGKTQSE